MSAHLTRQWSELRKLSESLILCLVRSLRTAHVQPFPKEACSSFTRRGFVEDGQGGPRWRADVAPPEQRPEAIRPLPWLQPSDWLKFGFDVAQKAEPAVERIAKVRASTVL